MSKTDYVWRPSQEIVQNANLTSFMKTCGVRDYAELNQWADDAPAAFWGQVIEWADFRFSRPYSRLLDLSDGMPWPKWCADGQTNLTINCLNKWRGTATESKTALVWEGEDGAREDLTYRDLDHETGRMADALRRLGLRPGDVIGLYIPNVPEAVIAFLAVARMGGIVLPLFSGFGAEAIATRLNDAEARAVLTVDGAPRRGRPVAMKPILDEALQQVPSVDHVIVAERIGVDISWTEGRDHHWAELLVDTDPEAPTEEMEADAPFMLIYTSGTTGKPKGVVHSHCGFPVKNALDLGLCMDLKPEDRILWMSDMGWLVGPMLITGTLTLGATMVLAEGAPDWPEPDRMWRLVADHQVSFLGIAPTVVRALMVHGSDLPGRHDLSSLRIFASTGEPWNPDSWMWLFEHVGHQRVPILNFSGGTEMIGIVTGTVLHPLKPCGFAGSVPGCGADVVGEDGQPTGPGEVGELVMRTPCIGLTRGLWRDPDRYIESYWSRIPDVWVHGDFASRDEDGVWYIHGRSDDTMKIAGKRTGPAEVESLLLATGRIKEAAAIGVPDPIKGSAILCAVVPMDPTDDAGELSQVLAEAVMAGLGTPFRPREIVFVEDLPKTRNMKIMRRVVRAIWQGQEPGDLSSLVNPDAVAGLRARLK